MSSKYPLGDFELKEMWKHPTAALKNFDPFSVRKAFRDAIREKSGGSFLKTVPNRVMITFLKAVYPENKPSGKRAPYKSKFDNHPALRELRNFISNMKGDGVFDEADAKKFTLKIMLIIKKNQGSKLLS